MDTFTSGTKEHKGSKFLSLLFMLSIVLCQCLLFSGHIQAEGTRQLIPNPTQNFGQVQIWDNISVGTRTFMTYRATNEPLKHLNIRICNVNERVFIGFVAQNNDVFFRVKDPNGNTIPLFSISTAGSIAAMTPVNRPNNYTTAYVNGSGAIVNASASPIPAPNRFTYRMAYTSTMPGFIANYSQAAAGPAVNFLATANGYALNTGYRSAIYFVATMTGDYFLEANPIMPDTVITTGAMATTSKRLFPFFDIAVVKPLNAADPNTNKILPGRVWSGFWDMTTNSMTNYFNAAFFVYTTDSIVTKLQFNHIGPNGFVVMCNSYGLTSTSNFIYDRKSRAGNFGVPEYKLFLQDPDNSCFPTGRFGQLNEPPSITGCDANTRCVNINVDKAGKAQVVLELSQITPQPTPALVDRAITWDLKIGNNCVLWDTRDGNGNLVPAGVTIKTRIDYFTGITHLPIFDVEYNLEGYSVSLIRPQIGGVPIPYIFWDDTEIPLGTTAKAQSQVATVFPGSPQIPANWTTSGGAPIKAPLCGVGSLNNGAPAGYSPFTNTLVTTAGQCAAITNGCTTTIGCMNGLQMLNEKGCVNAAGCHLWNWGGNNGSLTDYGNNNTINQWWYANIINTTAGFNPGYIIADAETRIPRKVVNGKALQRDTILCKNNNVYNLSGLVTVTGLVGTISGIWRSASPASVAGTFAPNANYNQAISYTPSAFELARDSVKIYLYATTSFCPTGALDSLVIRYSPSPVISISGPSSVCANNASINLSSNLSVASGIVWGGRLSTGAALTGTFSPATSRTPSYILGTGESPTTAPPIVLIISATTTGNGRCNSVASTPINVTVNPAFTVSIPGAITVCANQPTQPLSAVISNGITTTTGRWSTNGDGTFTNGLATTSSLNTSYAFGTNDKTNGTVTLSLISTGNGNCNASSGSQIISLYQAPSVVVGPNATVCENNPTAILSATASNSTSTLWSVSSSPTGGTFSPGATALGISFTPSAAQIAQNSPAAGNVSLTLQANLSGCVPAVSSPVQVSIQRVPTVNAGSAQFVCSNNPTVTLSGSITPSSTGQGTSATWSGSGTFFPSNVINTTTTGVRYTLSASEIAAGRANLSLTSNNNGTCRPITSTVTLFVTNPTTLNIPSSVTACANNPVVTVVGSTTPGITGVWTSAGTGTIGGSGNTLVYTASATDIATGSVTLTFTTTNNGLCNAVSQSTNLTFTTAPTVSAGSNRTVCANNPSVTLNGSLSGGATGVQWLGGNGSFSASRTTTNPTYTPSASEISSGLVTLTITSIGNQSNCLADSKTMTIAITPAPTVNPGSTFTRCSNNANVPLNGTILIGSSSSTGVWSGGNGGSFNPSNSLNTVYTPSAADLAAGSVLFTLTPNNVGNCIATPASLLVGFTNPPTVNPGSPQTVCGTLGFVDLTGSITLNGSSSTGIWSGGLGTFSPNNPTVLSVRYFPTPSEISSGSISLSLTSTNSTSGCNAVTSTVAINFSSAPTVDAGNNQTVCGNNFTPITFNGIVSNSSSILWTTNASGSFTNTNTLNPVYTPNNTDRTKGLATFTLTSFGGSCGTLIDSVKVFFANSPTAFAGNTINICNNAFPIQLNASGSAGTWSGGPAGNFSPNNTVLNPKYTPTATQTVPGSFTLTYTTNPTAGCSSLSSTVTVNVSAGPTIKAGQKTTVCANNPLVSLNGTVTGTTGQWSSSGSGTFSSSTGSSTNYTPSAADIFTGRVLLTFSTQGGTCAAISDTLSVIITPAPQVTAMANQSICSNTNTITLSGSVLNAGGAVWRTSGNGLFANNTLSVQSIVGTNLNSNYQLGGLDVPFVTISLTSNLNGICSPVTRTFTITSALAPTANAGMPRTICSSKDTLRLTGNISNAAGSVWTSLSPSPGTFDNAANLNAIYTPSASELSGSTINLRLTTNGNNGSCAPAVSTVQFALISQPTPSSGSNQTICADVTSIPLSGSINIPFTGVWSSSGTGTFTGGVLTTTSLNTNYFPSNADLSGGSFSLFLRSAGSTVCGSVQSRTIYTVNPIPTVNPGNNLSICADVSNVQLNGDVKNAPGGVWTTTATGGLFLPNNNASTSNVLNAIYQPSATAKANGETIVLTLSNLTAGTCNTVSKNILINITKLPTISATPIGAVCADTLSIPVSGTSPSITTQTFTWSTNGSGSFTPSNSPLSPLAAFTPTTEYRPSSSDRTLGTVNLTLTMQNNGACGPVSSTVPLTLTSPPTVNAGQNRVICATKDTINLRGSVTVATAQQWLTSGSGTFTGINSLTPSYRFSAADKSAGQVTLTLRTTSQGLCKSVSSSVIIRINPQPTANAGSPISICETTTSVGLNGSITTVSGGGVWSSSGSGSFTPGPNTLNAVYAPSAADYLAGSVNLTLTTINTPSCTESSSTIALSFLKKPVVQAGSDRSICADATGLSLVGTVSGAGGGQWVSRKGGTFSPNANTLAITYRPSAAAIAALVDTLILTSTGNAPCSAISDTLLVRISPLPTIYAGPDTRFCATFDAGYTFSLTSLTGARGIRWSTSGNGVFVPNDSLAQSYTASANDLSSGSVLLTGVTYGNGPCQAQSSSFRLSYDVLPAISAGPNITTCYDQNPAQQIKLNGSVNGSTSTTSLAGYSFNWSTNGSGTFDDETQFGPNYIPSEADKILGNVLLKFSAANNGSTCGSANSSTSLYLTPPPVVSPGANRSICASQDTVILNGAYSLLPSTILGPGVLTNGLFTVSGLSFGTGTVSIPGWTDLGFGFFANGSTTATGATFYNTIVPGWTSSAGFYTNNGLTVTSQNNFINGTATIAGYTNISQSGTGYYVDGSGSTILGSSFLGGTFVPVPWTRIGTSNNFTNGLATVSGSAFWSTTSPGGSFSLSNTDMNATYRLTAADKTRGNVVISLNSSGFSGCTPAKQDMVISIVPAPIVSAGSNQTICSNNPTVTLSGTIIQGTTTYTGVSNVGTWSSATGGTFSGINNLTTTFTPSASQIAAGQAVVLLTTTIGGCSSTSGSATIFFTNPTSINAGNTITICRDASLVPISGTVGIASVGGIWSTTSPGGTFGSATSLSTTYTPTAADTARGNVILTLTSNNNGNCNAVTSNVLVQFTPSVTLSGSNISVCGNAGSVNLTGNPRFITVPGWNYSNNGFFNSTNTISGGLSWTTTSTGTFSFANGVTTATSYNIQPQDITNGSVVIKLNTTGYGSCKSATTDYIVTFTPIPTVALTAPTSVCGIASPIAVTGTVTGATSGVWSTASNTGDYNGSGATLVQGGTTFSANFTPSATQLSNGRATIILTATNTGLCSPVSQSAIINFVNQPTLNAGSNITTCSVPSINLNGTFTLPTVGSASNPTWSTSGTGSFSASGNTISGLNVANQYIPSSADVTTTGSIFICMISTSNGLCTNIYRSCLTVNFVTSPGYTFTAVNSTTCGNNLPIALNASGPIGTWSGGAGTILGANTLNAQYYPTASEISTGATITFTITSSGVCGNPSGSINVKLTPGPTIGGFSTPTSLCANNATLSLTNVTLVGATTGTWRTSGSGQFLLNSTSVVGGLPLTYNTNLVGGTLVYVPSATDISAGNVDLKLVSSNNSNSCLSDSARINLIFTPFPTVNAGGNQTICANVPTVTLLGSVVLNGATASGLTGSWTTTATGLASSSQSGSRVTAIYNITPTDITNGSVKLYLRSTLTTPGICNQVSDSATIFITPLPVISGLATTSVCGDGSSVTLPGSISTASGIRWSGGTGTFSPSNSTLNASYTPGSGETGLVTLTLNATSSGTNCLAQTATVNVFVQTIPTITANGPYTICTNNPVVNISASGTGFTGATWSITSGFGNLSGANPVTGVAVYTAAASDFTSGVSLRAIGTGTGVCSSVSANTSISFIQPPVISAGGNRAVCINNPTVTLSGSFTGSAPSGVQWNTALAGVGTFAGITTSTSVVFTATNTTSPIKIYLTSTGVVLCNAVRDSMILSFTPAPLISGVTNNMICGDTTSLLSATVTVASGIQWSGGAGIFSPNRNVPSPTYTPDASEYGSVINFSLLSTGNGNCNAVSSTATLTVTNIPTLTTVGSYTICNTNRTITLSGTNITNASGAVWTSAGSGTFTGVNTTTGFAVYTASTADSAAGGTSFVIRTTGNGLCKAVTSGATLTLTPSPKVDAGLLQSICADNDTITLSGNLTPYTTFGNNWSVSGGATGTFVNANVLNAKYLLSNADRLLSNIVFTLSAATVGSCNASLATSTVNVILTPSPVVTAPASITVCADSSAIPLSASVTIGTNTSTGIWSGGLGVFSPTAAANTTSYVLGTTEANQTGTITVPLVFTSNNNGTCIKNYTSTTNIVVNPAPTIIPPSNVPKVCESNPTLPLTAGGTNATFAWSSTSGSPGTFTPATGVTVNYAPSTQEFASGSVNLQIIASPTFASCKSLTRIFPVTLEVQPLARAVVGNSINVCKDATSFEIVGYVINSASTSGWDNFNFLPINPIISSTPTPVVGQPNTYEVRGTYQIDPADNLTSGWLFRLRADPLSSSCNSVESIVGINFLDLPTISTTSNLTVCSDTNAVYLDAVTTGASGLQWSSLGSGSFTNAAAASTIYQPSASDKANGSVSLNVRTFNTNGCTDATSNIILSIVTTPSVTVVPNITACADGSNIQLNANLRNASSAQWSYSGSGGIFNPSPPIGTSVTFTPSAADTVARVLRFRVTTMNSNSCKPVSNAITLTFQPIPTISAGTGGVICADEISYQLNGKIGNVALANSNVLWTTTGAGVFSNPNASNALYTPLGSDIPAPGGAPRLVPLTLTYTDPGKCGPVSSLVILTVTSKPLVTASIGDACDYLNGVPLVGNVTFNNASSTGFWSTTGSGSFFQDSRNPNAKYVPSIADIANGGTYLVFKSTSQGSCKSDSAVVRLIIQQLPLAFPGNKRTICRGANVILEGKSNKSNVSYSWSVKTGSGPKTLISSTKIASYTVNTDSAVFYLTVVDLNSCAKTDSVTIKTIIPPTFSLGGPNCFIFGLTLTTGSLPVAGIPAGGRYYQWLRNDTLLATVSKDTLKLTAPGKHTIKFTYDACVTSASANYLAPPKIAGKDRILCENTAYTLSVNAIPKVKYKWFFNSLPPQLSPTSANSINLIVQKGKYLVQAVDTIGCEGSDTIEVTTVPKPIINIKPTSGACVNDTAILSGRASNIDTTIYKAKYLWYTGNFLYLPENDTTKSKISVTQPALYKLVYSVGECSARDSSNVVFNPRPVTTLVRNTDLCEEDSAIGLQLDAGEGFKYKWKAANESPRKKFFTGDSTRTIKITKPNTTYYVQVFNEFNCPTKDSIKVENICAPRIFPADAFTPNGDQLNDKYELKYKYVENFEFTVFSRWGEIIYYTNDPDKPWDGNYKGDPMPAGVYPWTMSYEGKGKYKGPYKKVGKVTIIR